MKTYQKLGAGLAVIVGLAGCTQENNQHFEAQQFVNQELISGYDLLAGLNNGEVYDMYLGNFQDDDYVNGLEEGSDGTRVQIHQNDDDGHNIVITHIGDVRATMLDKMTNMDYFQLKETIEKGTMISVDKNE